MAMGGEGTYMMAVLWSLTALVLMFLVLRAYTRMSCAASYGIDDHFYLITSILLVTCSSFMQVAAENGYGQSNLDDYNRSEANYWRMIGQTFSLLATGTSKTAVGFFLLRFTVFKWMRFAVWFVMVFMMSASVLATILTWVMCRPFAYAWDDRIEGGTCFSSIPLLMILTMSTVVADFFFAIIPWIFIWKLNAPRGEKIMIAGSLSLGILAAVAGTKSVIEVKGVRDVPVRVITWSHTETVVTLTCIGIPVCGSLWMRIFNRFFETNILKDLPGQTPQEGYAPETTRTNPLGGSSMPGHVVSNSRIKKPSMDSSLLSRLPFASNANMGYSNMSDGKSEIFISDMEGNNKDGSTKDFMSGIHSQSKYESWSSEAKRSWIVGEPLSQNVVISEGTCGHYTEDGIMTTKSYQVKRCSYPI